MSDVEEGAASGQQASKSNYYGWSKDKAKRSEELKALGVDFTPKPIAPTASNNTDNAGASTQAKGSAWNSAGTW
jgi:hypothetical protein